MPQASEAQRARWGGIDAEPAMTLLRSRGYTLTAEWGWKPPTPHWVEAPDEIDAVIFLICEWDFGPMVGLSAERLFR